MNKEFFAKQLAKLAGHRQVILEEHHAKIACPYHSSGKENTPSLRLNLDNSSGFPTGKCYCFACGHKTNWDEFVQHELIKPYKLKPMSKAYVETNLTIPQLHTGEESLARKMDDLINFSPLWDKNTKWRGISGKLLHKIQARELTTKYGTELYLPAYVNGEFYGGIKARLEKHKRYPSYMNDAGKWAKHTLFLYDYAKQLLDKQKHRVLLAGEGPRDSLNPAQYGVPAISIIGGKTVWSDAKAELILSLKPDLLVLAFDDDVIGNEVTELAKTALKGEVPLKRMRFKTVNGEKGDPGNVTKQRWLRLKAKLGLI